MFAATQLLILPLLNKEEPFGLKIQKESSIIFVDDSEDDGELDQEAQYAIMDAMNISVRGLFNIFSSAHDLERMNADGITPVNEIQAHLLNYIYARKLDLLSMENETAWRLLRLTNPMEWRRLERENLVIYKTAFQNLVGLLGKRTQLSTVVPSDVSTFSEALRRLHPAWSDPAESYVFYRDDPSVAFKFRMEDLVFQRVQIGGTGVLNSVAMLQHCLISKFNESVAVYLPCLIKRHTFFKQQPTAKLTHISSIVEATMCGAYKIS